MTERTDTGFGLTRLSDSDLILEDRTQDVRGLDVYDTNGEEIGTVEGLYVGEEERKVRFLDVAAGGFLGLGEKNFLLPVEAVREVNENGVVVDQSREKVVDSPHFDTSVVPQAPYQRDIYDYYGYTRSGGPASDAGIEPGGVITAVGSERVRGTGDLLSALRSYDPGEPVEITVTKGGEASTFTVELEKRG